MTAAGLGLGLGPGWTAPTAALEASPPPPPAGAATVPGVRVTRSREGACRPARSCPPPCLARRSVPGQRRAALSGPDPHRATGHASHRQRRSVPTPPRPASCELLSGRPAHPSTGPQQQQATQPSGHRTESRPGPGADVSEPRGAIAWNPGGCSHPIAPPPPTPSPHPLLGKAPQPGPGPQWGLPLAPSHAHPTPGGGGGQAAAPRLT